MVFFFFFCSFSSHCLNALSKWMTGSSHEMQLPQILIIDSQPKKEKKKKRRKILIISICGPKFEISTQKNSSL